MKRIFILGLIFLTGCASIQEVKDTALSRATFDMNCEKLNAEILADNFMSSLRYTVGVKGCDKRATYLVYCSSTGGGCVADIEQSPKSF